MPITNWTEFFREERDVYIQNIANAQVSLEFEIAPGHVQGFLFKQTRNPVNLTQTIPFDAIKRSTSFRKMLNRRPPVLQVLTEEEYMNFYHQKQKEWKLDSVDDAINKAEEERLGLAQKTEFTTDTKMDPLHKVIQDDPLGKKIVQSTEVVMAEEAINPRVLHLMNQVSAQIQESEKMKPRELIAELETVEADLKLDDLEHIRSHGYWKSVINWAKIRIEKLATPEGGGADDPQ